MADIVKGQIGNALESVAPDGIVATADAIYDETKGKYQEQINADVGDGLNAQYHNTGYYECPTAAATAAKTVTASGYQLPATAPYGGSIKVKFTKKNSAANPTLSINQSVPKPLYYNGAIASASNTWDDNDVLELYYDGTNFNAKSVVEKFATGEKVKNVGIDSEPTTNSNNLVKSGGVQNELVLGAVYDVSAKNPIAGPNNDGKWESLSALLSDANLNTLIPTAVRKGGMSIKFVQSSDNKYVQYRLMSDSFTTDVTQWQGTTNEVKADSRDLVESGAVATKLNQINQELHGVEELESIVVPSGGRITFDTITLKENGDAIEFKAYFNASLLAQQSSAFMGYNNGIAISLAWQTLGAKDSTGTWISEMNASQNRYYPSQHLQNKTVKLVYENNVVHLYINGVIESNFELTTQPVIKINQLAYDYVLSGTHYNWVGTVYKCNYTHNGKTISVEKLPGFNYSGGVEVNTTVVTEGVEQRLNAVENSIEEIGGQVNELEGSVNSSEVYVDKVKELGWPYRFNGIDSVCTLNNPIVLSQDGDVLEMELIVNSRGTDGYSFGTTPRSTKGGFAISQDVIMIAGDTGSDNMYYSAQLTDLVNQTIKIEYADGNVKFYRNGTLLGTYTGQKTITLEGIGHGWNGSYGYWNGSIKSIKVNGTVYELASIASLSNVVLYRENGFLTDQQAAMLSVPIIVSKTSANSFELRIAQKGSKNRLVHTFTYKTGSRTVDNIEYHCMDMWNADDVKFNGSSIFQGNLNMIYRVGSVDGVVASDSSVNEDCHVGSTHGCEVLEFCKFYADGVEIDPLALTSDLGCSVFRIVTKSKCFVADSSYSTGNANNYPKIVDGNMVVNGIHYMDAVYREDNQIDWVNRFIQKRDASIKYSMMNAAMAQAFIDESNVDIILNDADNSWNNVASHDNHISYNIPSGYESVSMYASNFKADTVIMEREGFLMRQSISNKDNQMRNHSRIYITNNNQTSVKCYLSPIITNGLTDADTIVENDEICVMCHRDVEFNQ